jgi:NO-binding membrane sensor protein with MHYT domain
MKYNNNVVYLSYAISFLGSYVTICIAEQLRLLYMRSGHTGYERWKWFILMGVALGGVGIWCMHFIGMSAVRYEDANGQVVTLYFNAPITILSLVISIVTTAIGIWVMSHDRLFAKTKPEIFEMFVDDLKHLSLTELKKVRNFTLVKLTLTKNMKYLLLGGCITGCGVCFMHYIGMAAMTFHGTVHWNWGIVVASVLIAVFAATAAFWILFRLLSIFPGKESLRLLSSLIMGVAVCGMHYTAMEAATMDYDMQKAIDHPTQFQTNPMLLSGDTMEVPTLLSAMFVLWACVVLVMEDLRKQVQKYQFHFRRNHNDGSDIRSTESSMNEYYLNQNNNNSREKTRTSARQVNRVRVYATNSADKTYRTAATSSNTNAVEEDKEAMLNHSNNNNNNDVINLHTSGGNNQTEPNTKNFEMELHKKLSKLAPQNATMVQSDEEISVISRLDV